MTNQAAQTMPEPLGYISDQSQNGATYEMSDNDKQESFKEAARVLADFAETAPGRLPGRVQDAIATVRAADNRDAAGAEPGYCAIHQSYKWCEHNGGIGDGRG